MNRTKIEYLDFTWNPVVGCEGVGCAVRKDCWARAQAKRQGARCPLHYEFHPHLHQERLKEPLLRRKPAKIGVCFMGDLYDQTVRNWWRDLVYEVMRTANWHKFMCLTKQPQNCLEYPNVAPPNLCLGVSVNTRKDTWRIEILKEIVATLKVVSFEPLYESMGEVDLSGIDWVIIGAQSRPNVQPDPEWVEDLMQQATHEGAAIFIKNNVAELPNFRKVQEFPWQWTR